jgi:hypothetical protein
VWAYKDDGHITFTYSGLKSEYVKEQLSITLDYETEQIMKTELKEDRFILELGYYWSELSDFEKAEWSGIEEERKQKEKQNKIKHIRH